MTNLTELEIQFLKVYWEQGLPKFLQEEGWPYHDEPEGCVHCDACVDESDLSPYLDMKVFRGVISSLLKKGVLDDPEADWGFKKFFYVTPSAWPMLVEVNGPVAGEFYAGRLVGA